MAYLLYLLDNTIFAEKSLMHVHICYLQYLSNRDHSHEHAWGGGGVVLVYLYDQLSYACMCNIKHMGGCMSLFMVRAIFFCGHNYFFCTTQRFKYILCFIGMGVGASMNHSL